MVRLILADMVTQTTQTQTHTLKQNHYLSVTTKVGLYPPGALNPGFL